MIKPARDYFFVSCPRGHNFIGGLKCVNTSHKHFFVSRHRDQRVKIEFKMFQDLVLAIVLVSYHGHDKGLYMLTFFYHLPWKSKGHNYGD